MLKQKNLNPSSDRQCRSECLDKPKSPRLGGPTEARRGELFQEIQAPQVVFIPLGLKLDHRLQHLDGEGLARGVERDRHPSTVNVMVLLVTAPLPPQIKAVTLEGADNLACRDGAERTVIERHIMKRRRRARPRSRVARAVARRLRSVWGYRPPPYPQ